MNILIVEDDSSSRNLMNNILGKYGRCDVASDGIEALETFKRAGYDKKRYDLICIDIMLPEKNGIEVLRGIRKYEKAKGIIGSKGAKIIMITAISDMEKIKEAFRLQCESYIIKPLIAEKVAVVLKKLLLI